MSARDEAAREADVAEYAAPAGIFTAAPDLVKAYADGWAAEASLWQYDAHQWYARDAFDAGRRAARAYARTQQEARP